MLQLVFRELSVGRGSTATFGGGSMPKIHTVEAWDGKDGQVRGASQWSEKKTKLFSCFPITAQSQSASVHKIPFQ